MPMAAGIVAATTGYIVVTADSVAIHAAPDPYAPVLQVGDDGDVFMYEGKQADWYRVVLPDQQRGWLPGGAAAQFYYPQYLFSYEPPEEWTPPSPFWTPPPDWVPPPNWVRRGDGWRPPSRWRPRWWRAWFNRHDKRWDDHRREWESGRGHDWGRSRDRDRKDDRKDDRDDDRGRGRGRGREVERR
ncbi:MAG TPA: SH3 domain-containing protein [Phycisphaerae bacterium]|nr:SH3 domain-containing protein [Phycisphaerae bacterium]